jgi:hypothetical protein
MLMFLVVIAGIIATVVSGIIAFNLYRYQLKQS